MPDFLKRGTVSIILFFLTRRDKQRRSSEIQEMRSYQFAMFYTYIAGTFIQKQNSKRFFPVFILWYTYLYTLLFFPNECPGLLGRHFI